MKYGTRLATGALVVSLALPGAAAAHQRSSPGSVRQHATAAHRALDRVRSLLKANRDLAADRYLRRGRRQLRSAEREATRLRGMARGGRAARRAAGAEGAVGLVADDCANALSALVARAGAPAQLDVAKAITACVTVREHVVEALTQLLEVLPAEARPAVADLIAKLSSGGGDDVARIGDALETPGLPPEVAAALKQALELATQAIDDGVARLQDILELLPPEARPYVEDALKLVTAQLDQVKQLITGLLGDLLGGGSPAGGSGTGGLPGLGVLQGLFGPGFPFNLVPIDLPFGIPGFGFAVR